MGRAPANVAPAAKAPEIDPSADVHLWDSWLLRDRYGGVATVDGWQVLFSLTADSDLLPEARHDVAEIRYFYSRNGQDWEPGGTLFEGQRSDSVSGQGQPFTECKENAPGLDPGVESDTS